MTSKLCVCLLLITMLYSCHSGTKQGADTDTANTDTTAAGSHTEGEPAEEESFTAIKQLLTRAADTTATVYYDSAENVRFTIERKVTITGVKNPPKNMPPMEVVNGTLKAAGVMGMIPHADQLDRDLMYMYAINYPKEKLLEKAKKQKLDSAACIKLYYYFNKEAVYYETTIETARQPQRNVLLKSDSRVYWCKYLNAENIGVLLTEKNLVVYNDSTQRTVSLSFAAADKVTDAYCRHGECFFTTDSITYTLGVKQANPVLNITPVL